MARYSAARSFLEGLVDLGTMRRQLTIAAVHGSTGHTMKLGY